MKLLDVHKTKYHGRNVNEVEVPPELRVKVKTGVEWLDYILGNGATPSTAWMLQGDPGVGKTTLVLTIADALTKQGHIVIHNGREESVYQVKMTAERLGLTDGFIIGEDLYVDDLIKHAEAWQAKLAKENAKLPLEQQRRVIVMPDSLQCLDDGKYDTGRRTKNTPVNCATSLIKWAKNQNIKPDVKRVYGILMFINQVTKDGNFVGDNTLAHAVDARLEFGFDRGKKSPTYGERMLRKIKDRFGPAIPPVIIEMGEGGRLAKKDPPVEEADNSEDNSEDEVLEDAAQ